MQKHKLARAKLPPVVLAVVRPVSARLARIEALLIEMRSALDAQIKRTGRLEMQVEVLALAAKRRK